MVSSGNHGLLAKLDYSGFQGSIGLVGFTGFLALGISSLLPSLYEPQIEDDFLEISHPPHYSLTP